MPWGLRGSGRWASDWQWGLKAFRGLLVATLVFMGVRAYRG